MNIHTTFHDRLRAAMLADGRSAARVAKAAGYDPTHIRRILNGRLLNPTIGTVWSLAGALRVDPLWLLGASHLQPPIASGTVTSSATGDHHELLQEHPER